MVEPTPTVPIKTYHGQCHCAAFAFTIEIPELTSATECNCSFCFRRGYKWIFPMEGRFTVTKGEGALKVYEFGNKTMAHKFCPTCGTGVMGVRYNAPPGKAIGINARTLKGVDVWSLKVGKYDGAALKPLWNPPKYTGPEPVASIENSKIYTGSCHCGAVTLALKTAGLLPPAVHEEIVECDCSICIRNGGTLCYPRPDQVSITGIEKLTTYSFSRAFQAHHFCSVCGVYIFIKRFDIDKETWERESTPGFNYKTWPLSRPVNLRCFEGVEWDEIKIVNYSLKDKGPKYEA